MALASVTDLLWVGESDLSLSLSVCIIGKGNLVIPSFC